MYSHFSKVPQFPVIYKLVTLKEFQQETAGVGSLIYVTSTGYLMQRQGLRLCMVEVSLHKLVSLFFPALVLVEGFSSLLPSQAVLAYMLVPTYQLWLLDWEHLRLEQSWLLHRTFNPEGAFPRWVRVPQGAQTLPLQLNWLKQRSLKPWIEGSSPSGGTILPQLSWFRAIPLQGKGRQFESIREY